MILNLIKKIGFFRLVLVPIGISIIIEAYQNKIIGMAIIGIVVLIFGLLNKCLLMGKCDVDDVSTKELKRNQNNIYQLKNGDRKD